MTSYDVVVPSVGRPSLRVLLDALAREQVAAPVVVVDDRTERRPPLVARAPRGLRVEVVEGDAAGPASARNAGLRATAAPWVAFLDDDVVPRPGWAPALVRDLRSSAPDVAGVQGLIAVPLPRDRRPTDWERCVAGLARGWWITADMAYRRDALEQVGGFDERFGRAYREDADVALRLLDAGWRLRRGTRASDHPVPGAPWWISVAKQAGNADDALMDRLHGRGWRARAGAPAGRRPVHVASSSALVVAAAGAAARHRGVAGIAAAAWLAATAELVWRRVAPGPRTVREIGAMAATSVAIPFAATAWWLRGVARARRVARRRGAGAPGRPTPAGVDAVLVDRDGTIVVDVPYNGDPARVEPMPGAREALARLRAAGLPVAVVTNQSGVARGLITPAQVAAVNARVDELLGPFTCFVVCPHGPADRCGCRKPAPGLVEQAAARLGVAPSACAVIGDVGVDVEAARRAGAFGVLVPTAVTRPAERRAAAHVVPDISAAVDLVLACRAPGGRP